MSRSPGMAPSPPGHPDAAQQVEHRLRDVTASGVRLRVLEAGAGPAVVLIHGLFRDHGSWLGVIDHLRNDFRVVAPDLPGFGSSEKPAASRFPYGITAFAEAITDLYAGLGLGRAAVVGHGMGGAVALMLAAHHPELVSRLVLVDTLCHAPPMDASQRLALLPVVGGLVFKQLLGKAAFRTMLRDTLLLQDSTRSEEQIDHYYELFNTPAARGSALATLRATVDTRDVVAQTTRIRTPTLVAWGQADKVYHPSLGQRLAREIRGAGFHLLGAGHAPQEECPLELGALIARFIRDERCSHY